MDWTQVAAVVAALAAIFAALAFAHGAWVRWPRLALIWRPHHVGTDGTLVKVRLEVENRGGTTARHAVLQVDLDGAPLLPGGTMTLTIAPDGARREDFDLRQSEQALVREDGTIDLRGKTLRASVTYKRTAWWTVKLAADYGARRRPWAR